MRDKKRPRRAIPIAIGVTTVCIAGGMVGVGTAIAQGPPSADEYNLSALTRPAAKSDVLPAEIIDSGSSIQHNSARLIAEKDGVRYWAGLDEEGSICLVAFFGTEQWVSGQSCTTEDVFLKNGAGLRVYGPEGLIEAYLVPDGVEVDGPTTEISENVYIADPYLESAERTSYLKTLDTSDGFNLAVFQEPFSLEGP